MAMVENNGDVCGMVIKTWNGDYHGDDVDDKGDSVINTNNDGGDYDSNDVYCGDYNGSENGNDGVTDGDGDGEDLWS